MEGWVKLHRSLLFSSQFQNENELKVWIWLLCKASTADRFTTIKTGKGKRTIPVKRGQLVFGRISAEAFLKIDQSTIYRIIKRFEAEGCISVDVNSQYSIISVTQYNTYQSNSEEDYFDIEEEGTGNEQPMNMQRTGNEQATNTQRTPVEHPTNTVKKVYNKENNKEGGELEEGKELKGSPALFPIEDQSLKNGSNGEADPKPPSAAPLSPKRAKKPETLNHIFQDSPYFDIEALRAAMVGTPYEQAHLEYYRETILNWADSKGEKKKNWLAAVKGWIGRDVAAGRLIKNEHKPLNNNTNGTQKSNGRPSFVDVATEAKRILAEKHSRGGL